MKNYLLLLLVICSLLTAGGQPLLKTIVPNGPLTEGEPFTIQYTWQDVEGVSNFKLASFNGLTLVNGPVSYKVAVPSKGQTTQLQNFVFTLVAPHKGVFKAPIATAIYKGMPVQSSMAVLNIVVAKKPLPGKEDSNQGKDQTLGPGEDPYKKIHDAVFLRMQTDRSSCYTGEPVVATYKLYTRMESRSDIIRNPGFYGFAVHDIIDLSDHLVQKERINGKDYDVHVLRQVQLYPMQAGELTVDGMELKNRVRLSSYGKGGQQLAEGMLGTEEEAPPGEDEYETVETTPPVKINVKELPARDRPEGFSGAVGQFSINARLLKTELAKNESGILELQISGRGNFIQLTAPTIKWPSGLEGFEAIQQDSLDKRSVPLTGIRRFNYSFISSVAGEHQVPSVQFVYFDPATGKYRIIQTAPLIIKVLDKELNSRQTPLPAAENKKRPYWLLLLIFFPLLFLLSRKLRRSTSAADGPGVVEKLRSAEERLGPASSMMAEQGMELIHFLRKELFDFLEQHYRIGMDKLDRKAMAEMLIEKGVGKKLVDELCELLAELDLKVYAGATNGIAPGEAFERCLLLMKKLESSHSAYL